MLRLTKPSVNMPLNFMARIARRTINNIIIFAMLIMIALFNFDMFFPRSTVELDVTLLPENAHILKIEYPDFTLNRVAETFVFSGNPSAVENLIAAELVQAWLETEVEPLQNGSAPSVKPYVVTLRLANFPNPFVLTFYSWSDAHVALNFRDTWYLIDKADADRLLIK